MLQRTLFPDAFEVQERALAALDELDLDSATRLVAEARARDPDLVQLEELATAVAWLRRELGSSRPTSELVALAFSTVPEARSRGEITSGPATLIDAVLARRGLRCAGPTRAFLDAEETLHLGALLLVVGRDREALELLRETLATRDERADLWAAFGDACHALERLDEANAAFVRALVLSARDVDIFRVRHAGLAVLRDELVARHGEASARELLLVEAWLAGELSIPPENGWLDRHLSRLRLAVAPRGASTPAERLRRFTLLFYVDRSHTPRGDHWEEREEMQALEPELFARVMERAREQERRRTSPIAW